MASTPFKVDDGAIGDNANGIYATMADIAAGDGSANTLLITEGYNQPWYPQLVAEANAGTPGALLFGSYWFVPVNEAGGEQLFGFSGTPTATTRIINGGGWFPSSVHPGGAVAAFADGSTRFLRQDLQPHVYGHLVTRRSVWNGTTYSTNSPLANGFLQCSPAPKPYTLKAEDY
jgi:prepilin-type processing-associated H-X9-DG protein